MNALTEREREVIELSMAGLTAREIGEHLGITTDTARTHTQNILRKTKARNMRQAIAIHLGHGMVVLPKRGDVT